MNDCGAQINQCHHAGWKGGSKKYDCIQDLYGGYAINHIQSMYFASCSVGSANSFIVYRQFSHINVLYNHE